jgi:hypothetical protein
MASPEEMISAILQGKFVDFPAILVFPAVVS